MQDLLYAVRLILRQGLLLTGAGIAIGLTLAVAAVQLISGLLFGASPMDPVTFAGSAALFTTVGLAACLVPVRRAVRIEATEALRHE